METLGVLFWEEIIACAAVHTYLNTNTIFDVHI